MFYIYIYYLYVHIYIYIYIYIVTVTGGLKGGCLLTRRTVLDYGTCCYRVGMLVVCCSGGTMLLERFLHGFCISCHLI